MTDTPQPQLRHVRGTLAFLLSLVSPSLGFFYARRTRTALAMVVLQLASVAAAIWWIVQAAYSQSPWIPRIPALGVDPALLRDWGGIILSLPIAAWAAIAAWMRPQVARAGSTRLFGYLAIWLLPLAVALGSALYVRENVAQPFRIPSASMQPTLSVGDYFISVPVRGDDVHAGDVIVYRDDGRDFVKRVVALPGQRIAFADGVMVIDGAPVARVAAGAIDRIGYRETIGGHTFATEYIDPDGGELGNYPERTVPPRRVFVVGDARDISLDSRMHGPVAMADIRRRAVRIVWSSNPDRIGAPVE